MSLESEEKGARFLMVLFPIFSGLERDYAFIEIHNEIRRFAEKNDIPFIDLYESFKGKESKDFWVHALDQHPNAKAHKITAQRIQDWCTEVLKIIIQN